MNGEGYGHIGSFAAVRLPNAAGRRCVALSLEQRCLVLVDEASVST